MDTTIDVSEELTLQQQAETEITQQSNMERLTEMMLQMSADDKKEAQLREE